MASAHYPVARKLEKERKKVMEDVGLLGGITNFFAFVFALVFLIYCVVFISEFIALRKSDENASAPRMVMYGQYTAIFACLFNITYLVRGYVYGGDTGVAWISLAVTLAALSISTWRRSQLPKDFDRLPIWHNKC